MHSVWMSVCTIAFTYLLLIDSVEVKSFCRNHESIDLDIGSKTLGAEVVFEGVAKHRTPLPGQPQLNIVVFKVHQVLKGKGVRRSEEVRVGYFSQQDFDGNLTIGSRYLVFVGGPSNPEDPTSSNRSSEVSGTSTSRLYHVSSFPEEFSNKTMKEVRKYACAKCARLPKISKESKSVVLMEGQKLTLHCRASGRPSPCITWFKDGVEIKAGKRIIIKEQRRDSRLQIRKVGAKDFGIYRCQATNLLGSSSSREMKVNATVKPHSKLCLDQNYCFNRGICYEVSQLKTKYCECVKGFVGLRCEEKHTARNAQVVKGVDPYHKRRKKKRGLDGHHRHQQIDGT